MRRVTKGYSGEETPLFATMLVIDQTGQVADEAAFTGVDVVHGGAATTVSSIDAGQGSGNITKSPTMPHDSPLPGGHTPGSDEGKVSTTAQVSTADPKVTTVDAELNTASTFVNIASPQRHAYTATDDLTLTETLMEIRKSAAKDKGKAKMDETESPRKMKQREQVQISRDEEEAQKLQEEVAADEDLVQQLQAGEKCSEEDLPMKLVELVN
ncbi:hypothetical protein Tco_0038417, partial [Tanacetum coccineum]